MNRIKVAITGMACRLPGASSLSEYWDNLVAGSESITTLTESDLVDAGVAPTHYRKATYVNRAPVIERHDAVDSVFFGIPKDELEITEPQQKVLYEVCYNALHDAGMVEHARRLRTGVYVTGGGSVSSHLFQNAEAIKASHGCETGGAVHVGNDKDFLATKISYRLDLTGPAFTVQSACSSSMAALKVALQALQLGEIDLAIVAASNVRVPHKAGYNTESNPIASKQGSCKPFSADADGTIFGSGVAAIVLTPCNEARERRDQVYCNILSCALNNDGGKKVSYTASSVPGQAMAMAEAIRFANMEGRKITYIEAHGTATKIGDPLETKALKKIIDLVNGGDACGFGSVKGNIGHLEQAAGMASLIKVALMLKHRTLVPSINSAEENPKLNLDSTPLYLVKGAQPWGGDEQPRIAGVNCLGIGGTNAFAVLEEAMDQPVMEQSGQSDNIFHISAKTPDALMQQAVDYLEFLQADPHVNLDSLCGMSAYNNYRYKSRAAFRFSDIEDLIGELKAYLSQSDCQAGPLKSTRLRLNVGYLDAMPAAFAVQNPALLRHSSVKYYREMKAQFMRSLENPEFGEQFRSLSVYYRKLWKSLIRNICYCYAIRTFLRHLGIKRLDIELSTPVSSIKPLFETGSVEASLITQYVSKTLNEPELLESLKIDAIKPTGDANALDINDLVGSVMDKRISDDQAIDLTIRDVISEMWVDGAEVDLTCIYPQSSFYKISTPGYPFKAIN